MPAANPPKNIEVAVLLDEQGLIAGASRNIAEILGVQACDCIGLPIEQLVANLGFEAPHTAPTASLYQWLRAASGRDDCNIVIRDGEGQHTEWSARVSEVALPAGSQLLLVLHQLTPIHGVFDQAAMAICDSDEDKAGAERLKWAYDQRDNLVREVHHRIKNNLQSVTGLLRRQMLANPAASEALKQAIGQVEAIALTHGLESSAGPRRLRICDMLCGMVDEANKWHGGADLIRQPIRLQHPALVRNEEAVPIALTLNELLTNAVKHHCPLRALDIRIAIARNTQDQVIITISNPAEPPPPAFDFAAGVGIGQGLKLVRAMIPKEGLRIEFQHSNSMMTVTVTLQPPIIYADTHSNQPELSALTPGNPNG